MQLKKTDAKKKLRASGIIKIHYIFVLFLG